MRRLLVLLSLVSSLAFAKDEKLVSLETKKTVTVAEFQDAPKLLVYWATWCKGCSQNIDAILKSADASLLSKGVRGISVDESMDVALTYFKVKPHLQAFQPVSYLDAGGEWAAAEKLDGLPAVALVNAKGERVKLWMGVMKPEELKDALTLLSSQVTP